MTDNNPYSIKLPPYKPPSPYIAIKADKSPLIPKGLRWDDPTTVPWLTMAEVDDRHDNDLPVGVHPALLGIVHIDVDKDKETGDYKVQPMEVLTLLSKHDVAHELIDSFSGKAKHILVAWDGDNLGRPAWYLQGNHGGELIHSGGYAAIGDLERYREAVQRLKDKIKAGDGKPMTQAVVDALLPRKRANPKQQLLDSVKPPAEVIDMLGFVLGKWNRHDKTYEDWCEVWMAAHHASNGAAEVCDFICQHPNVVDGERPKKLPPVWAKHISRADGYTAGTLVKLARDAGMPRPNNLFDQARTLFMAGAARSSKRVRELTGNAKAAGIVAPDDVVAIIDQAFAEAQAELNSAYFQISAETLEDIFARTRVRIRQNLRHHRRIEYHSEREPFWQSAHKGLEAKVRRHIRETFKVTQIDRNGSVKGIKEYKISETEYAEYRNAIGQDNRVDPFLQWVESLGEWDGRDRFDTIDRLFGAIETTLAAWAMRYLTVGPVLRAISAQDANLPPVNLDEMPVFVGAQGIGKSAFLRALLPPEMQAQCYSAALKFDMDDKQIAESGAGKVIVEAEEMRGRNVDPNRIKSIISRADDGGHRLAYRENAESIPRLWVLAGTTNDVAVLPNDHTGLRRFVVVELLKSPDPKNPQAFIDNFMGTEREKIWAQALHMARAGVLPNLPYELKLRAAEVNEGYRQTDSIEDRVAELEPGAHTLDEIAEKLDLQRPLTMPLQRRLGKALRQSDWLNLPRQRRNGKLVRLWQHPDVQSKLM